MFFADLSVNSQLNEIMQTLFFKRIPTALKISHYIAEKSVFLIIYECGYSLYLKLEYNANFLVLHTTDGLSENNNNNVYYLKHTYTYYIHNSI